MTLVFCGAAKMSACATDASHRKHVGAKCVLTRECSVIASWADAAHSHSQELGETQPDVQHVRINDGQRISGSRSSSNLVSRRGTIVRNWKLDVGIFSTAHVSDFHVHWVIADQPWIVGTIA